MQDEAFMCHELFLTIIPDLVYISHQYTLINLLIVKCARFCLIYIKT